MESGLPASPQAPALAKARATAPFPQAAAAVPAASKPPESLFDPMATLIDSRGVSVFYEKKEAIKSVSLTMPRNRVIAMIGPSGCGKSTFLRSINRLNDLIPGCRVTGQLMIGGQNIYDPGVDLVELRRQVGLVFQKPNPFPKSIYDNVAYGPRLHGLQRRGSWTPWSRIAFARPPSGTR